ncbi:FBD-associated F-box protein At4g10400-like [Spinacia oleracea]|uniref:FBD-associated F-box protein At4g10400-like n=1 Tax=Spinacia oleracea TaxID=3562 RepID=A0ABM3RSE1_SPIOL|nr:FBD-associated F-box protein At4g10400-like [Spinacia oleracea]
MSTTEGNTLKRWTKKNKNSGEFDRISSLPDPILIEILSLLPLNSAFATNILARRWQHLWTQITSLNIVVDDHSRAHKHLVTTLEEKILPKLPNQWLIHKLNIVRPCFHNAWWASLDSWFCRFSLAPWNIREIKITYEKQYIGDWSVPLTYIFQIPSVVVLELLSCDWSFLYKDDCIVNLPNLKKLKLHFGPTFKYCWLKTLIESCPTLEELSIRLNYWYDEESPSRVLWISGRNLKRLSVWLTSVMNTVVKEEGSNSFLHLFPSIQSTFNLEPQANFPSHSLYLTLQIRHNFN